MSPSVPPGILPVLPDSHKGTSIMSKVATCAFLQDFFLVVVTRLFD